MLLPLIAARLTKRRAAAVPGWWEAGGATGCVFAYQPKGAASLAASYTNLANPGTYDAYLGVAPGWNATDGWVSAGGTVSPWSVNHLRTGYSTPNKNHSAIVRFSDYSELVNDSFLGYVWDVYHRLGRDPVTAAQVNFGNGSGEVSLGAITSGTVAFAGQSGYKNGSWVANGAAGGWTAHEVYVLSHNYANTAYHSPVAKVQAVAMYDNVLSAAQVAAVHAAMMAL